MNPDDVVDKLVRRYGDDAVSVAETMHRQAICSGESSSTVTAWAEIVRRLA